ESPAGGLGLRGDDLRLHGSLAGGLGTGAAGLRRGLDGVDQGGDAARLGRDRDRLLQTVVREGGEPLLVFHVGGGQVALVRGDQAGNAAVVEHGTTLGQRRRKREQ